MLCSVLFFEHNGMAVSRRGGKQTVAIIPKCSGTTISPDWVGTQGSLGTA